jgi:hypothetical protein
MLRWTCLFLASTFPRFQDIDNTINFTQYDACKLDVFLRREPFVIAGALRASNVGSLRFH